MGDKTEIQWSDATWNPTTGCDRVSPGCDNCYALTMAGRLQAMGQPKYQRDGDPRTSGPGFGLTLHHDALELPLRWAKPRRIFVNSMSDLFHDQVPDEFIADVWHVMARTPRHTYQILTKRHARMRSWVRQWCSHPNWAEPLPNVWLGCSVEDQKWADIRVPVLLETPAAIRWLSCEPLLGPVTLAKSWVGADVFMPDECGIDWVVAGGESGPGARPMHPGWARSLRNQCAEAGVPFFMKQLGEWAPDADNPSEGNGRRLRYEQVYLRADGSVAQPGDGRGPGTRMVRCGGHNGDPERWPPDLRVRQFPLVAEAVTS